MKKIKNLGKPNVPLRGGGGSYTIGQCKGWAESTKAELRDASVEVVKVPVSQEL
jgi:hypothetical protein